MTAPISAIPWYKAGVQRGSADVDEGGAPSWSPARGVEIIAGTPRGGGQDRTARALAAALDSVLEVPIEVSNVAGRGGGNAWDLLAVRQGDGHVLSISSPTLLTNPITGISDLGFDRLTQVARLHTEYILFAVPAGSSLATAADLIDGSHNWDALTVAFATAKGNINHIALAQLCRHSGSDARNLAVRVFDSAPQAAADVLAGNADLVAVTAASLAPQISDGSLRALAVSGPSRLAAPFDGVPCWKDLGVDCDVGTWRGVVGAPGLSASALVFWENAIGAAVATVEWCESLVRHLWSDTSLGPVDTHEFMRNEHLVMQAALTDLGLTELS